MPEKTPPKDDTGKRKDDERKAAEHVPEDKRKVAVDISEASEKKPMV
jgi:hypothetical protein